MKKVIIIFTRETICMEHDENIEVTVTSVNGRID